MRSWCHASHLQAWRHSLWVYFPDIKLTPSCKYHQVLRFFDVTHFLQPLKVCSVSTPPSGSQLLSAFQVANMSYPFFSVLPRQAISLDGPTIAPPEGSVPDFDNPPNGNSVAIAIITVCVVVSSMLFLLRFYAKFLTKKPNASDCGFTNLSRLCQHPQANLNPDLTAVAFPLFWVYVWFSYRLSWTSGYLVNMWNIRLKDISAFSYVRFRRSSLNPYVPNRYD